jgi:ATP-binding cassette subfamily F protein 3
VPLLAVTNLSYSIGDLHLLDGVSLSIEPGDRIGLVGRNGAGKSTLMKIMSGQIRPDSGQAVLLKGRKAAYLQQDPTFNPDETLRGEAEAAFADLHRLHRELDHIYEQLALPENAAPEPMQRLLDQQIKVETAMELAGGYDVGHKIDAILHGLGFEDQDFSLPVRGLSGGQRGRLALAQLLLEGPDLLLLDEPTNHLDIAGREWLEEFLVNEYKGAVLVVSHDRYLLDRVVTRIVEVEDARLIDYPGSYDDFREQRDLRRLTMQRAYEKQQTKFKAEEAYIRRYKAGQRAKQAKGRETRLDREKLQNTLERPAEFATLSMDLPKAPRSGDLVITAIAISKSYPALPPLQRGEVSGGSATDGEGLAREASAERRVLFHDLNLKIGRAERWGIIGPNGAGKTTLMKCILGDVPLDSGTARVGANVVVGHYRQIEDAYDPASPVYQFLQTVIRKENPAASLSEQAARNLAGAFLFSGDDQGKRMGVLSGGERSRARLAALLASGKNLLILDEPTNHLDIPSAERLEQALLPVDEGGTYDGTLILISHDRALIDATCDNLIVFDGHGGATTFAGNYSEWHEQEQARRAQPTAPASKPAPRPAPKPEARTKPKTVKPPPNLPKNPLSWLTVPKLEAKIEESHKRLKSVDADLGDPEIYRDKARTARLLDERAALAAGLEDLEAEWLRRSEA